MAQFIYACSICLTYFTHVGVCNPSHKMVIRRRLCVNICVLEVSVLGQIERHKCNKRKHIFEVQDKLRSNTILLCCLLMTTSCRSDMSFSQLGMICRWWAICQILDHSEFGSFRHLWLRYYVK